MVDINASMDWLETLCNGTTRLSTPNPHNLISAGIILPPYLSYDVSIPSASHSDSDQAHAADWILGFVTIFFLQTFKDDAAIVAATLYCWEYLM